MLLVSGNLDVDCSLLGCVRGGLGPLWLLDRLSKRIGGCVVGFEACVVSEPV